MPPSSGTYRVMVLNVAARSGDWQNQAFTGFCAADMKPSVDDTTIAAYLQANGAIDANAIRSRHTEVVFCAPDCFALAVPAGVPELIFNPYTAGFIFNPGGGQEIIDTLSGAFPTGILVGAVQIHWRGTALDITAGGLTALRFKFGNIVIETVNDPNLNNTTRDTANNAITPAGTVRGIISTLATFGLNFTFINNFTIFTACGDFPSNDGQTALREYYLKGNYATWSAGLAIAPATTSGTRSPQRTYTLTDTNNKLDQLTNLFAYYRNDDNSLSSAQAVTILSQSAGTITFRLSEFTMPNSSNILITGSSNGPEFLGETNLGVLENNLVNGSGLYTLVPGKRNDTYYDRSVVPSITIDLPIPIPSAKTGFFNA